MKTNFIHWNREQFLSSIFFFTETPTQKKLISIWIHFAMTGLSTPYNRVEGIIVRKRGALQYAPVGRGGVANSYGREESFDWKEDAGRCASGSGT